jgi:hypothetical protein
LAKLDHEVQLFCDTPGVTFEVPWLPEKLTMAAYGYDGSVTKSRVGNRLRYPAEARHGALFAASDGVR